MKVSRIHLPNLSFIAAIRDWRDNIRRDFEKSLRYSVQRNDPGGDGRCSRCSLCVPN